MVEIDHSNKEKGLKIQRDSSNKLATLEKNFVPKERKIEALKVKFKQSMKSLKMELDVEGWELEKKQEQTDKMLKELEEKWT
jgi:predicted RNase H-like nuclease (RuvC/YqgF family)